MKTMGRTTGCREIQREIDEADQCGPLSSVANEHLQNCASCETFYSEQSKLRQIVSSLGTVAAPGDFDFRLRARLAGEKRGAPNPFGLINFSLGFRSAAFATVVLLIGSALVFVSLRPTPNSPLVAIESADQPKPDVGQPQKTAPMTVAKAGGGEPAVSVVQDGSHSDQSKATSPRRNPARRIGNTNDSGLGSNEVAMARKPGVAEIGSTPAKVFKPEDMVADAGHSVFPIQAAAQSVKVSLDNGRGSSKTISLPGVSFGSQRVLTESAPPLLASSRGAW